VMLIEGVIEGSGGPVMYPDEELGRNPHAWNGQPIVLYHPEEGGVFVSAKRPTFFDTRKIGTVFNTEHQDRKLKPELWFDEDRTRELDERVYSAVLNGQPMELSTGLDADLDPTPGEFNGKKYVGTVRNFRPDHLAMLPDKVGACSVAMGAGLYANAVKEPESTQLLLDRSVRTALKAVGVELVANELSFGQVIRTLSDLVSSRYGTKGKYWNGYVSEVYQDYAIFVDEKGDHYRIDYSAADEVKLVGSAVQVVRTVEYKAVSNSTTEKVSPVITNEVQKMFDKKVHIDALIANGQIEESQRAAFEALPDATLQAMKVVQKTVLANTATVVPQPAPVPVVAPPANLTEWLTKTQAPPEVVAVVNQGQMALNAQRTQYVNQIKASPQNKFTDAALAGFDLVTLAAMAELARGQVVTPAEDPRFLNGFAANVFAGAPGGFTTNAYAEPPEDFPDVPEMTFDNPLK